MKHYLLICFSLFSFSMVTSAQTPARAAKSIYAEIGGPGLASFNYDMRFKKKEDGLGFRVGVGGFGSDGDGVLFVPVGLNYLLGKDGKNYFELGAGMTIANATFFDDAETSTFGHLNFGYRMQPKNGGFTFRAAINPIFGKGYFMPFYGGVAFGYKF